MLISELEAQLKELREQHGDIPICEYCAEYDVYKYPVRNRDAFYYGYAAQEWLESLARRSACIEVSNANK